MKSFLVTYDLNTPGQDYSNLYEAIENVGPSWHCLDSTWIVKTSLTAAEIRDNISPLFDANDQLLVVKLSGEGAWKGFKDDCSSWLKNNL